MVSSAPLWSLDNTLGRGSLLEALYPRHPGPRGRAFSGGSAVTAEWILRSRSRGVPGETIPRQELAVTVAVDLAAGGPGDSTIIVAKGRVDSDNECENNVRDCGSTSPNLGNCASDIAPAPTISCRSHPVTGEKRGEMQCSHCGKASSREIWALRQSFTLDNLLRLPHSTKQFLLCGAGIGPKREALRQVEENGTSYCILASSGLVPPECDWGTTCWIQLTTEWICSLPQSDPLDDSPHCFLEAAAD